MRTELLRQAMQAQGLRYRDLARKTGLGRSYLHRVIRGEHQGVSARNLAILCRTLGVRIEDVLADELRQTPEATKEAG